MDSEVASPEPLRHAAQLHDAGRFLDAEALLREAIAHDPENAGLYNARGVMFAAMGQHLDALWCYRDALARDPKSPGIWTNLGNTLTQLRYLKRAVACHKRAIRFAEQDDTLLYHNLGTSLAEASMHEDAVAAFTRALEIDVGQHMARWDRARSNLYLGKYREGFADYEVRRITGQLPHRQLPGQPWSGERYAGKRLVLLAEQGFGDTIWAARYLSKVKELGGELVVESQPELIPLVESMNIADNVVALGRPLPEAEYHCYLCTLPHLFTVDVASIPAGPYLTAPQDRMAKFKPFVDAAGSRLKVGVVWSGSVTFKRNSERARSLLHFFQGFALPGVQLYSLQKGAPEAELHALPRGGPIVDLSPLIADFADTAAAVAQLDLVVMTDSAVAHLAGAMGKPIWVLLGHVAHWLWLLDRVDSPWYPSMRLFRPRAEGDWDNVFDAASVELMKLT